MIVYGENVSGEEKKKRDVCGAAGCVEDGFPAKADGVALVIDFQLFAVPVLGELTDGHYELGDV